MNTFLILFSIYFLVAMILEIIEFKDYVAGKVCLAQEDIIEKQIENWTWPLCIVLGILAVILYGFLYCFFYFLFNTFWKDV